MRLILLLICSVFLIGCQSKSEIKKGYAPPKDRDPKECYYEPHGPNGTLVRACYEQK